MFEQRSAALPPNSSPPSSHLDGSRWRHQQEVLWSCSGLLLFCLLNARELGLGARLDAGGGSSPRCSRTLGVL